MSDDLISFAWFLAVVFAIVAGFLVIAVRSYLRSKAIDQALDEALRRVNTGRTRGVRMRAGVGPCVGPSDRKGACLHCGSPPLAPCWAAKVNTDQAARRFRHRERVRAHSVPTKESQRAGVARAEDNSSSGGNTD